MVETSYKRNKDTERLSNPLKLLQGAEASALSLLIAMLSNCYTQKSPEEYVKLHILGSHLQSF